MNLSQRTGQLIEQIRSQDPTRSVGGGRKNVTGRYPSRKMGCTIQFESYKVELPRIYELEYDPGVLEYYDQPPPIKLDYLDKNGRNLGVVHTPDYFVITSVGAFWEECKTENELLKLSEKSPARYIRVEEKWRCPPGEKHASSFGLSYRLWSDSSINWTLQRNLIFLEDYYRGADRTENTHIKISHQGIKLQELLAETENADDIYRSIAMGTVYVDLFKYCLTEPEHCPVFSDYSFSSAYILMERSRHSNPLPNSVLDLAAGATLLWDNKGVTILHIGDREITLRGDQDSLIVLKIEEISALIQNGKIKGIENNAGSPIRPGAWDLFYQASPEDQSEALYRYRIIEPYLCGEKRNAETVSARTIRDWKAKYLKAQQQYGCGYVGLLSPNHKKGNRETKLPLSTLEMMDKAIEDDYETIKQKSMWTVYCSLVDKCEELGLIPPSYKTFTLKVKQRAGHELTQKRQGSRAAYSKETFYWELHKTIPRHGMRPMEIAHIDHTELDVELVCSLTGRVLGRPWATFMVDAYSRRLLAVYLTFDPPSYRSCLMIIRLCVQRHQRLPQTIVVDNGAEFHSVYFETLLATFECTKKNRPPAKARFGAVCERLFGTSNSQFVHNLLGNTQITKNVRQVTKSVNPKNHAVWTLGKVYEYLCFWAYEVYDELDHPALGQSPRSAFALGIQQTGLRSHRFIAHDENFLILTLPTTTTGKAKVRPSMGVKINYIYYWANVFRDPEIEGTDVPVRFDPFDAGTAYAYVRGYWVKCTSQYYPDFQGRSEREIKLASKELIRRFSVSGKKTKVSAMQIARFLSSIESEELLLQQRQHDKELGAVFTVIGGGYGNGINTASTDLPLTSSARTVTDDMTLEYTPEYTPFAEEENINLEIYGEF